MFKLKYNLLVTIQMLLGIINYILLLRVFGVSIESDAYLLAISSNLILFTLTTLPISQVIPYYNDLKQKSVKQSHEFYNSSIFFSFCLGIIFFICINVFLPFILRIFAFNLEPERFELFKILMKILSFGLIFYPVNQINEQLLNAEMKFSLPYILNCIPLFFVTTTQIIMLFYNSVKIEYLAISNSIGIALIAVVGTLYISKTLIKFKFNKWHPLVKEEIRNSIILKIGDFGYSIAIPFLFNNFLVSLSHGYISYFYYAKKILDITNNFTIGPSAKILRSKISKDLAKNDFLSIKKISKSFSIFGGIIFIITIIIAYYLQAPILKFVTGNKLTDNDIIQIALIYLTLIPWYIIIFLEIPFATITQMAKKAKEILCINMIFLTIFAPLLFISGHVWGIYSLGLSTSIAQLSNLVLYIYISRKYFKLINKGE